MNEEKNSGYMFFKNRLFKKQAEQNLKRNLNRPRKRGLKFL